MRIFFLVAIVKTPVQNETQNQQKLFSQPATPEILYAQAQKNDPENEKGGVKGVQEWLILKSGEGEKEREGG